MTIVRKDFKVQLDENEIKALKDTQYYLNRLSISMSEELLENEKKSNAYFAIQNNVQKILNNINTFWDILEIISK